MEWKKNPEASTYLSFLETGARVQRNDHLPTTNTDSIKLWLKLD